MRKLIAALACRNQGSRLYGKPLQNLDIANRINVLDNIIDCLQYFECIEDIVLGIADGNDNLAFIDYAKKKGLGHIIGDEIDVLGRLIQCGEHTNATDIFRVTSESPFPYFEMIDKGWKEHLQNQNDATFLENIIDGCGFEIIRSDALKESHQKGQEKHRSELCTLYIRECKDIFKIQKILPPKELIRKDIRLTVDYPEDLIVCRAVFKRFQSSAPFVPLLDVVEFLDEDEFLRSLVAPFCEIGYGTMYL